MFGRETRMLMRHYLEQGSSKSELARQLGVSRDTIHRLDSRRRSGARSRCRGDALSTAATRGDEARCL